MAGASIQEVTNRDAKASRIANHIRRAAITATIEAMRTTWLEHDWLRMAELIGEKKPSEITRVLVFQRLREMAK